jgi:hypothetical protein
MSGGAVEECGGEGDKEQPGKRAEERYDAPNTSHRCGLVEVRKGNVGNGNPEKATQGLPAVLGLEDQQPLWRYDLLDALCVLLKYAHGVLLFLEATAEKPVPYDVLDHLAALSQAG